MKKLFTLMLVAFAMLAVENLHAARAKQNPTLEGIVLNENNIPVEYATVVLLASDSTQAGGTVSDQDGRFKIDAPKGRYTLAVYYMGYDGEIREVNLLSNTVMEALVLKQAANQIEDVVVKGRLVTREADRFVVDVANNPAAIGKTTYDMLKMAPGVWIKDDEIKINGQSGTRVMINDRLLTNMSQEDISNYLRSIPAENIQKIEVIPVAGAEYDADSTGGILKITLKKQRNEGLDGNVRLYGLRAENGHYYYSPSLRVNYQRNKLNLYVNGSYSFNNQDMKFNERIDYMGGNYMTSTERIVGKSKDANAMAGFVYDFNDRNSFGAEFNMSRNMPSDAITDGTSQYVSPEYKNSNKSRYIASGDGNYYSLTFNYVHKLDSLGSTFKLIGDYASNISTGTNDYRNTSIVSAMGNTSSPADSTYRSDSDSDYRIYALTANVDKVLSPFMTIKFGGKFSYNDMYSRTLYRGYDAVSDKWIDNELMNQTGTTDYTEKIGALYFIYSTKIGNLSLSAGLRGEYTSVKALDQEYVSLFPNANVSWPLNEKQTVILVGAYSRKISRPSFWALNPQRVQLSEYSYIIGNPDLKPTYTNDFSLTGVLFYKYSVTLGGQLMQNNVQQICMEDPANPNVLMHKHVNVANEWQYYVNVNAPFALAKWWNVNANVTSLYLRSKIYEEGTSKDCYVVTGSLGMNFTLPKNFFIDVDSYYMSDVLIGNQKQLGMGNFSVSLKKRFAGDRFTVSLGVDDILDCIQKVSTEEESFKKFTRSPQPVRAVNCSLTYNFKAGKKFNAKSVETGAGDETSRMNK